MTCKDLAGYSLLQVDDNHRIYAARFNERLLAACGYSGTEGAPDLCAWEVTRRRGVGQHLLEEVLSNNLPFHAGWRMQAWKSR